MAYTVEELRDKFNLSYDGEDIEYSGQNADDGHYWATMPGHQGDEDGYQHKVYLGHNADTEGLLGKNKLRVASESTKYNHNTDVARGLAGLLHGEQAKTDDPSPSSNSANEAVGDVPDNFWDNSGSQFWDSLKGAPDDPLSKPGMAPGPGGLTIADSFNTNANQSNNTNVVGDGNTVSNDQNVKGSNFLANYMDKKFSKRYKGKLFD